MPSRRRNENGLTPSQQIFADEWLKDPEHNATEAYKKAYKTCKKDSTANANGSKLLADTRVDIYIKKRQAELMEIAHASQERVILEERRIAFCDIRGLFDGATLISPDSLPEDLARAVQSIKIKTRDLFSKNGDQIGIETTYEYKFWDKGRALERLSKILGLYEKDNNQRGITFEQLVTTLKSLDPGFADRVCTELANSISG